jgi:hypothetical protein
LPGSVAGAAIRRTFVQKPHVTSSTSSQGIEDGLSSGTCHSGTFAAAASPSLACGFGGGAIVSFSLSRKQIKKWLKTVLRARQQHSLGITEARD